MKYAVFKVLNIDGESTDLYMLDNILYPKI